MAEEFRVKPPKRKKEEEKSQLRRSYNKIMLNSKRKITDMNEEFFSPEYLKDQKFHLKCEIKQLKSEIRPLQKEMDRLQEIVDAQTEENKAEMYDSQFFDIISEEQKESAKLDVELASTRRHISDATKIKLQFEKQNYEDQINQLYDSINRSKIIIKKRKYKLERIQNSDTAHTIIEQQKTIDDLKHTLKLQENVHSVLKKRSYEMMKNSPINAYKSEIETLKKKNEMLDTIKMRKMNAFKKKFNELYYITEDLKRKIRNKREQKKEKEKKEAYLKDIDNRRKARKNQNKSLIISRKSEEKPKSLPLLNQTKDPRRVTIQQKEEIYHSSEKFDTQKEYSDHSNQYHEEQNEYMNDFESLSYSVSNQNNNQQNQNNDNIIYSFIMDEQKEDQEENSGSMSNTDYQKQIETKEEEQSALKQQKEIENEQKTHQNEEGMNPFITEQENQPEEANNPQSLVDSQKIQDKVANLIDLVDHQQNQQHEKENSN